MSGQRDRRWLGRMLGEFAIIVVGVLTALAADSWLTDHEDARRTQASVGLLLADLEADSIRMSSVTRFALPHDTVTAILFSTPPKSAFSSDSAVVLLKRLMVGSDFVASRSTFETLIQTDGVRYLGPPELQTALVHYYQERQADVSEWYGQWRTIYVRFVELAGRHVSPAPNSFEEGMLGWRRLPAVVTTSWAELRSDSELMSQIWVLGGYEQNLLRRIEEAQSANSDLRARLAASN